MYGMVIGRQRCLSVIPGQDFRSPDNDSVDQKRIEGLTRRIKVLNIIMRFYIPGSRFSRLKRLNLT